MRDKVLVDTGPLVAFLDRRDQYHDWVTAQLASVDPPLLTCEAVLTETCFLVRGLRGGGQRVIELLESGLLRAPFRLEQEAGAITRLLARYANVPMSLADACLVRMAEQHAGSVVLTLDSDFRIYRKQGRHLIPTIMPSSP